MKKAIIVFIIIGLISFTLSYTSFSNIELSKINIDKEDINKFKNVFKINFSLNSLIVQKSTLSEEKSDKIYFQEYISSENIKDINIKTKSSDIIFKTVNNTQIQSIFEGKISKLDKKFYPELIFNKDNTTLNIEVKWPDNKRFVEKKKILVDASLTIFIPKDIAFGIITVSSNQGNILNSEKTDIICNKLYNETVSGNIKLKSVNSNLIQCNTVSGDINYIKSECSTLYLKTVSGDLIIKDIYAETIFSKTVSGYTEIFNMYKKGKVKSDLSSVSGNILYNSIASISTINVNTTSGNSIIVLPEKKSYRFKAESLSGKITINKDAYFEIDEKRKKYGDYIWNDVKILSYYVYINSISGDISINHQ